MRGTIGFVLKASGSKLTGCGPSHARAESGLIGETL